MNAPASLTSSLRLTALLLTITGVILAAGSPYAPPAHTRDGSPPPAGAAARVSAAVSGGAARGDLLGPKGSYGNFPLRFEANRGQVDSEVKFLSRGRGYDLFLTPSEAVLALSKDEGGRGLRAAVRAKLRGANPRAELRGEGQFDGFSNYLVGNDPSRWRTNIPSYAKVVYEDAYPGVDLAYYGRDGHLEYDFIVSPGADPDAVALQIEGARGLSLGEGGDLVIKTDAGDVRMLKPSVYQESGAGRVAVAGRYVLKGRNVVGFDVASYDEGRPLVVDPVIEYATFLGGVGDDRGLAVAVDAQGHAYVAGLTTSPDFPTKGTFPGSFKGTSDAFVAKLSPDGTDVLWAAYFGGGGNEQARGIALDPQGNAYITGVTDSNDLPAVNAFQPSRGSTSFTDAFVAKLSADDARPVYSTYLGGWRPDTGDAIAVDSSGSAYVTGNTGSYVTSNTATSRPFPTSPGAFQTNFAGGNSAAFVTKLTPAGDAVAYSTFLGGLGNNAGSAFGDTAPDDLGLGIAVDSQGGAVVTGRTESEKFPRLNAAQQAAGGGLSDAFVTKLNASGTGLVFSTFVGGAGEENRSVGAVAVGRDDSVYLAGATNSTDFPVRNALQPAYGGNPENEAFVTKLGAGGAFVFSTYLGSSNFKRAFGVAVDGGLNAYVTGTNLLRKLSADGSAILYSQTLGGEGRAVALDAQSNVYVTGLTTTTTASAVCTPGNFCPTPGAVHAAPGGGVRDAFVIRVKSDNRAPVADAGADQTVGHFGVPVSVTLDGSASSDLDGDALTYEWRDAGGNVVGNAAQVTVALGPGTYVFTLAVGDYKGGTAGDAVQVVIEDKVAPVLTLPGDIETVTDSLAGKVVTFGAAATDDVDGVIPVNCTPASGSTFPLGVTTVVCAATDSNGNTAQGSFKVTVNAIGAVSKTRRIDFERYPGPDGVFGTADDECTADGDVIAERYSSMGVHFRLTGATTPGSVALPLPTPDNTNAPTIRSLDYPYVPGSPRALYPKSRNDRDLGRGDNALRNVVIRFDRDVSRVRISGLDADEDLTLRGFNAAGTQVDTDLDAGGSGRAVNTVEVTSDAAHGYIRSVVIDLTTTSESCCDGGPEFYDLLEFDEVSPAIAFTNTRSVDFEKYPGADGVLDTGDDTPTAVGDSASTKYSPLGVTFALKDGSAPVIRRPGSGVASSPLALYLANAADFAAHGGDQRFLQDLTINFTTPVSRVRIAAIDADEPWVLRAFNQAGVQVAAKSQPGSGNSAVFSEIRVDSCDTANLIWKVVVDIRQDGSASCCDAGPEYLDFLSFDAVDAAAPVSSASVTAPPNAEGRNNTDASVALWAPDNATAARRFSMAAAARPRRGTRGRSSSRQKG